MFLNETASGAFSDDIEMFEEYDLKNREITAGNGANLPDTETGDALFLWKNSTNQFYDSGKPEDNNGKYGYDSQFSDDDRITYIPIYEASSEQSNPLIADFNVMRLEKDTKQNAMYTSG